MTGDKGVEGLQEKGVFNPQLNHSAHGELVFLVLKAMISQYILDSKGSRLRDHTVSKRE